MSRGIGAGTRRIRNVAGPMVGPAFNPAYGLPTVNAWYGPVNHSGS